MNTRALNRSENVPDCRIRTLVVDDSPFMLKTLSQILEQAGHFDLVGSATDGCQALRYVTMLSPELVVMDAHMPRLNGIQATRSIKQRADPPVVIIVTSDDSAVTRTMAEEAGADGLVTKDGNLRDRLLALVQDLFRPNAARCRRTSSNAMGSCASPNKASEKSPGSFAAPEALDGPSGILAMETAAPGENTARRRSRFLEAYSAPERDARVGSSTLLAAPLARRSPANASRSCTCALPHGFSPREKAGSRKCDTMKTRKQSNTAQKKTNSNPGFPPTIEEIRQRAHEIFMARGGAPGSELADWLRAEQELKRERADASISTAL